MSWFSDRFATSLKVAGAGDGDRNGEDDSQVTELSELTKTLTRQLWGVASFLAPPPSINTVEEANAPSFPKHRIQPGMAIDSFSQSGDFSLSQELVDVDFQASADSPAQLAEEVSDHSDFSRRSEISVDEGTSHAAPDQGLTGVGKDLAELKGSVAIGFSKFLKVVREEIDRGAHGKESHDHEHNEEEEDEEENDEGGAEPKGFVHGRKIPVLNSLFKPFLSGVLQHDGDDTLQESGTDDDYDDDMDNAYNDPFNKDEHQKSHPSGAMNLGRTLGRSLGGFSKLASSLFPVNLDSDDEQSPVKTNPNLEAVGVTEEVLTFARNISMHPETWLDFPLFTDDDEDDDFEMSDAQKDHVLEVERASPRLAALRIELCPDYMSEGRFWKIYFVLLHSRLSKKDAVLLSTPQIMEARSLLLSNLQKKASQGSSSQNDQRQVSDKGETSRSAESFKIVSLQSALDVPARDFDQVESVGGKHGRLQSSGDIISEASEEVQNKNVLANTVKLATVTCDEEEADVDRWLHGDSSPHFSVSASTGLVNDDDVSFSDLEEDDETLTSKGIGTSNLKGTQSWVELNKDEQEKQCSLGKDRLDLHVKSELASKMGDHCEPSDWLTLEEDLDFA